MNEFKIKKYHPHPFYYFFYYLVGLVVAFVGLFGFNFFIFVFGLVIVFMVELIRQAENFYFLENGLSREFKLIIVSKNFVEYQKIQNFYITQNILEKIFGLGSIIVETAGSSQSELIFYGLKNFRELEELIRKNLNL